MKVGSNIESDLLHGKVTRSVINDPANLPKEREPPSPSSIKGKNAGPTGNVLMSDANQVWDVPQAIEYVKRLAGIKPWILEEPTVPDGVRSASISFRHFRSILPSYRPLHHIPDA